MFAKKIVIIFGFMFNETQPPETTLIKLNGENNAPMVGERLEIGGRDGRSCPRNLSRQNQIFSLPWQNW